MLSALGFCLSYCRLVKLSWQCQLLKLDKMPDRTGEKREEIERAELSLLLYEENTRCCQLA